LVQGLESHCLVTIVIGKNNSHRLIFGVQIVFGRSISSCQLAIRLS
jgi:hypothetical protein